MIQRMFNEIKDEVVTRHLHYIEQKTNTTLTRPQLKLMYKYLTSNIETVGLEIKDDAKLNLAVQEVLEGKAIFNEQPENMKKLISEMQSIVREEVTDELSHIV
ncbi:hypothetical protein UT300012_22230 [Paraclostridium bifermentans]